MNHSLGIWSSGVKFAMHLVHFMTNFELQFQKVTKSFSYFWLQLVKMKSSKKRCPWFLITFLLFEIVANITFLLPLKSVLRTAHFLRNGRCGFGQRLFPQLYTAFKGITSKIFWVWAQNIIRLQRILSEDLYFFIGTVTLIHLQD